MPRHLRIACRQLGVTRYKTAVSNSPASFFTSTEEAAITIDFAFPATSDPLPMFPVNQWDWSLGSSPLLHDVPLVLLLVLSDKLAQSARERPKVLFLDIRWHLPRQGPSDRNQGRSMRANDDSLDSFPIRLFDDFM